MGLVNLMKKLKVDSQHVKKLWFFKINSFLKNENLRLYSLSIGVALKNLETNNLIKFPDPRDFVIGMNYVHEKISKENIKSVKNVSSKF
jgi:hypothetical protein